MCAAPPYARAPSLISVLGLLWPGDMMVDGVIPLAALRPLGLSGPVTEAAPAAIRREPAAVDQRDLGQGAYGGRPYPTGCRASSPSSRRV